jgi:hypothetical protein
MPQTLFLRLENVALKSDFFFGAASYQKATSGGCQKGMCQENFGIVRG